MGGVLQSCMNAFKKANESFIHKGKKAYESFIHKMSKIFGIPTYNEYMLSEVVTKLIHLKHSTVQ